MLAGAGNWLVVTWTCTPRSARNRRAGALSSFARETTGAISDPHPTPDGRDHQPFQEGVVDDLAGHVERSSGAGDQPSEPGVGVGRGDDQPRVANRGGRVVGGRGFPRRGRVGASRPRRSTPPPGTRGGRRGSARSPVVSWNVGVTRQRVMISTRRLSTRMYFGKLWGKTGLLRWTCTPPAGGGPPRLLRGLGEVVGPVEDHPDLDPARDGRDQRIADHGVAQVADPHPDLRPRRGDRPQDRLAARLGLDEQPGRPPRRRHASRRQDLGGRRDHPPGRKQATGLQPLPPRRQPPGRTTPDPLHREGPVGTSREMHRRGMTLQY